MSQKFVRGDRVFVNPFVWYTWQDKDGVSHDCMSLGSGEEATVCGSYSDQFGGPDTTDYTLEFDVGGKISWFPERVLELVAPSTREKLLEMAGNR